MNIEFQVTGVKYRRDAFNQAQPKRGDYLTLRPEPDNEHDSHAVAVYKGEFHIGYVPRNENQQVGRALAEEKVAEVRVSVDWPDGCEARVKLKDVAEDKKQLVIERYVTAEDGTMRVESPPFSPSSESPRVRAEQLRNFVDPLHGHDTDPLRNYIRMTGGHCSGGGGPC